MPHTQGVCITPEEQRLGELVTFIASNKQACPLVKYVTSSLKVTQCRHNRDKRPCVDYSWPAIPSTPSKCVET